MDDNYKTYLNRVARMMLPEAYRSQVQHIQSSAKFQLQPSGETKAVDFPGYTIITPPADETAPNFSFWSQLQLCQAQLLQLPLGSNFIVPTPPSSFHVTLADLIWENAYRDAIAKNPNFEQQLRSTFTKVFQQYQAKLTHTHPLRWQMLGLIVMPRAVGVCLIPQDEESYDRIVEFRRAIYQHPDIFALGIEQHYHFTAHATLGYFNSVTPDLDRDSLSSMFSDLNQQWLELAPEFVITRAELCKFDDMTRYYREPDWPVVNF